MTTYYDITLTADIPHGSGILDKSCTVTFTYPDGSHSTPPYSGKILAWQAANRVRISSSASNIEAGWVGANGGTLTINTRAGLNFGIYAFSKVP